MSTFGRLSCELVVSARVNCFHVDFHLRTVNSFAARPCRYAMYIRHRTIVRIYRTLKKSALSFAQPVNVERISMEIGVRAGKVDQRSSKRKRIFLRAWQSVFSILDFHRERKRSSRFHRQKENVRVARPRFTFCENAIPPLRHATQKGEKHQM